LKEKMINNEMEVIAIENDLRNSLREKGSLEIEG